MEEREHRRAPEADREDGNWLDLVRRDPDEDDDPEARPSANQHSFAGEASTTDTARHYHGPDKPAERRRG